MNWPNPKLCITGLVVTLCSGFPVYHMVVINPAEDVFKGFLNESYARRNHGNGMSDSTFSALWGFMIAIINIGALVGVFFSPTLNERLGRKGTLLLNNIPNLLGTLLFCLARKFYSIEMFAVGRFLVGINLGVANGALGLYLTEISPSEVRGLMGSLQETCLCFICTFGMIIGIPELIGSDQHVYLLLGLPIIPSFIHLTFMPFLPESPKHLLLTKLDEHATDKSLQFYHGPTVRLADVKKELEREKELQTGESMSLAECFRTPNIRRGFLIGMIANLAAVLTGISAVFFFSTDIFYRAGVPLTVAKYSTVVMTSINSIATLLNSTFLVPRFGRRPLLLISLLGCLLCHIIFVLFSELYLNLGLKWTPYIAVGALIVHVVMFSVGAGPLVWFLTTEFVPQAARSKAQAFAGGAQWSGAVIDGLVFYPLFYAIGPYALLVTSVVPTSIFLVVLFFYMPETKDKDVNAIFAEYDAKRIEMNEKKERKKEKEKK